MLRDNITLITLNTLRARDLYYRVCILMFLNIEQRQLSVYCDDMCIGIMCCIII